MGVFETAVRAMRGGFDFRFARAMESELRQIVEELPDAEICGNGLFVKKHMHYRKDELLAQLDTALEYIESAEKICTDVSLAL